MRLVPLPPLLIERSARVGVVLTVVVPTVYGAVCGAVLGASKIGYLILSLLAIVGGFVAGLEHEDRLEGVWRGLTGGLLFGTAILVTHDLIDNVAKSKLPDPPTLLIVITAVFGAALGGLGARSRNKRKARPSAVKEPA